MINSKRKKEIIAKLSSGNPSIITGVIKELRDSGSPEILPYLFDTLLKCNDSNVQEEIMSFLQDVKNQDAAEIIAGFIQDSRFNGFLNRLVGICWQSGLDFSAYTDVFVQIAIDSDYLTCIEAFSVIENTSFLHPLSGNNRKKYISLIEKDINRHDMHKKKLLEELIRFFGETS